MRKLCLICVVLLGCLASIRVVAADEKKLGKSNIAGVNVSGLTVQQARGRLRRELTPRLNSSYILTDGRITARRQRRHLGVSLNLDGMVQRAVAGQSYVPLLLKVDTPALQRALRRVAPAFSVTGQNARVGEWRGKVVVVPERNWRRINVPKSAALLAPTIAKHPATRYLRLQVIQSPPTLTANRLKGINGVLGRYNTRFNAGNVKRTQNLRLAIKSIDGTLLSPKEVFSLNGTVGERTQARGYRTAIIFQNSYKVPGIGAGVSQATGTLFNAALLAGLDIVTYRTHSRPVDYIPLGRDATVAWGGFDMKFRNNTGAPVYIKYSVSGSRATAVLFGKKQAGQKVSLNVRSQRKGPREIIAQLYRTIRHNGKVVRKERVGSSHYKWKTSDWYD